MKNFIVKNWFKLSILIIILLTISLAFYWFEWRPSEIKKQCVEKLLKGEASDFSVSEFNTAIDICLKKYGI